VNGAKGAQVGSPLQTDENGTFDFSGVVNTSDIDT